MKEHSIGSTLNTPLEEKYVYTYDQALRPLVTSYYLNGTKTILADQSQAGSYDELGRLKLKKRHNGTDIETYDYNIRNWAKRLTSGAFEENLYYNTETNLPSTAKACYNGNIALSSWTYNEVTNKYGYIYDDLNRLTSATTYDANNQCTNGAFFESFDYDKMGNIKTIGRMGSSYPIDNLTLAYNGNQLKKVTDLFPSQNQYAIKEYNDKANEETEFLYDANGNMTEDLDRDIVTIQYNILNLPDIIQFKNGNQIKNTYDASGRKLQSDYFTRAAVLTPITPIDPGVVCDWTYTPGIIDQSTTIYVDNKEYLGVINYIPMIDKIYNSEGYVSNLNFPPAPPIYYYYRKDHLGNNREVWSAAYTNTVILRGTVTDVSMPAATLQQTQYYPSGLPWASNTSDNPSLQARKYNGKEFIEMSGYDTYDYGARVRMGAVPIFPTKDPLAEMYYSLSPYVYCKNNPVNYIDPNGEFSLLGAAWFWLFHGGGNIGKDHATGEYFVGQKAKYTGTGTGVAASRIFDTKGRSQGEVQYGQTYGEHNYGTASSQMIKLPTSKYHGPTIDMKEASNDAIDMLAKVLNRLSNQQETQTSKDEIEEDEIDKGIVTNVDGTDVEWKNKSGIHHFNAKGVKVNDIIEKQRVLKTIRNGKVMKRDTLLYDTYPIGK